MAIITGDSGANTLAGASEDDIIRGLQGNDRLEGRAGQDTLYGGHGRDTLLGGGGMDLLFGGSGNDTLYGGGGNDILVGGLGRDVMYGGAGADVFRFDDQDAGDATAGPLSDVIADFGADDMIDLTAVDVLFYSGWTSEPARGSFSIWEGGGNTYVSWYTFGCYHDIELTGYSGDLYNQIIWYEDDFTSGTNTSGEISAGQSQVGNIEVQGDRDWFRITLTQGELYTIDLAGAPGGPGSLRYPHPELYDADGNWIADGYDYDGDGDAQLLFLAETSGTYFISASSQGTGTYLLEVTAETYVDDFGNDATTAGQLAAGESVTGLIGTPYDEDWFQITLDEGIAYSIDLKGQASGSGTLPYSYLNLYDAGGFLIDGRYGDDIYDAQLVYSPSASGTYFIAAGSDSGYIGTYLLEVTAEAYADDYGNDASTAGQIASGGSVAGVIGVPNDEDWFEIALADDETYTIDLKGQDSGSGTLPDPYLILYDADGNWVADNDDSGSLDSQLVYTPEVSGTYFIVAREVGAGTGTYALSVGAEEAPQVEDSLLMV